MGGTDALVEDLLGLLAREQASVEPLSRLLGEEWTQLRSGSPDTLSASVAAKLNLLEDIRILETQRASLVEALAAAWGLAPADVTLREIAARVPAVAEELLRLGDRLRNAMTAALTANRLNGVVIERVRGFLEESLTRWRPVEGPSLVYSGVGTPAPAGATPTLLDRRG